MSTNSSVNSITNIPKSVSFHIYNVICGKIGNNAKNRNVIAFNSNFTLYCASFLITKPHTIPNINISIIVINAIEKLILFVIPYTNLTLLPIIKVCTNG